MSLETGKKNASCPGTGITGIILGTEIRSSQHLSNSLGLNTIFLNIKILLLDFASISCKYPVIKTKCSGHSRSGTCGMFCLRDMWDVLSEWMEEF